jgi:3-phenylpropionate/trans-cinnamate dioxygenase ferredoxin reductase subunit
MEEVPEIGETKARLTGVRELAPDVVELVITPEKGVTYLPGQYFRFAFNGFPARPFSPTAPLDGRLDGGSIYLNVKRVRGGRVSPFLGTTIRPGHRLRMEGPYGHAFLRAGESGRLILVGSGVGFAPIWAVACMALRENRNRPIILIAGARRADALYMKPALGRVSRLPNVKIIPAIEEGPSPHPMVRIGKLEAHIPDLHPNDIVYACGSPRMVTAVAGLAQAADATFYADPFESSGPKEPVGILGILKTLLQSQPGADEDALEQSPA